MEFERILSPQDMKKEDLLRSKSSKETISIESFLLLCVIGKGSYAKVLLVRKKNTQEILALKVLKKDYVEKRNQQEHVQTERYILVIKNFRRFICLTLS